MHLPFCLKKCAYCDFVSYSAHYDRQREYLEALKQEFLHYRGEEIDTVYLGGGTPTSLGTEILTGILDEIFSCFRVLPDAEVTVECNPKTADFEKFCALKKAGVNRLSIGVQSLNNCELSAIGRLHTAEDALFCVKEAARAGFSNISADLMFSLPHQTVESLEKSIDGILQLPITHISCYGLILEEGTRLTEEVKSGAVILPDEDTELTMYQTIVEKLRNAGFYQYEISNFSKPGKESRHNTRYWKCEEYIGCGVAAHSYFKGERFSNTDDFEAYLKNPLKREEVTQISTEDQMSEFFVLGLRMMHGVSEEAFMKKFGVSFMDAYGKVIEKYQQNGLLEMENGYLRFTKQGVYVSNTVLCEFV